MIEQETLTDPAEILDAAASYMEIHGKCRGSYEDVDGRVCASGAIRRVCGYHNRDEQFEEMRQSLGEAEAYLETRRRWALVARAEEQFAEWRHQRPGYYASGEIINWSDTNAEETVVGGLRAAARYARGQA